MNPFFPTRPRPRLRLPFTFLLTLSLALSFAATPTLAKEKSREETLVIFGQRRIAVTVPEGFLFSSRKDDQGMITAVLGDPKEQVSLQVSFVPDPEGEFSTERGRKELMVQSYQRYVSGSVEQAMRFEELEPKAGAGTYCVFTDSALVGQTKYPAGEFLHSTTGVKSWRGCLALFTLFSNTTTGPEYVAAMKLLRDSVTEQPPGPFLPAR